MRDNCVNSERVLPCEHKLHNSVAFGIRALHAAYIWMLPRGRKHLLELEKNMD